MNASELRIGNLVNTSKGIRSCIDVMCDSVSFEDIECDILDNIEPIPLTEEWLLKFGFEDLYYGEDKFGWIKDGVNISKYFTFVLMLPNAEYYNSTKIKYVHELQNLYFALTGEELCIN